MQSLRFLHSNNIPVYLLSNSSQRAQAAYGRLDQMGFKREWITEIVTSGEMTHIFLLNRPTPFWQNLGSRCIHFTWKSRTKIDIQELDLTVISDPNEVDFILVHGIEAIASPNGIESTPCSIEEATKKLEEITQSTTPSPPMIVANPDFVTVSGEGLATMPGTLGKIYEQMGGEVIWMGKPGRIIYDHVLSKLGLEARDIVAIGDSLEHDIKGASAMGIDSVFICGGIHANEVLQDGRVHIPSLERLYSKHGVTPQYHLEYFQD